MDQQASTAAIFIDHDTVRIDHLVLQDGDAAGYLGALSEADRPAAAARALAIGARCLRNVAVTVDVDYVERACERLLQKMATKQEQAAVVLDKQLRESFADDGGRLPRTLERFLGDQGHLRRLVNDLFDDQRRDSAIGRMRTLLGEYFDGDGSRLVAMLDPTKESSPLHLFRSEVRDGLREVSDRILRLEAERTGRADERERGTAKGGDFEDDVEARLAVLARNHGDLLERTSAAVGDSVRDKVGDFVLTLNPAWTRGADVRIVIEAKRQAIGVTRIGRELEAARQNRSAAVAVAVFGPDCAPRGCAPLTLHGRDVLCEFDPEGDPLGLDAAIGLARALALSGSRSGADVVDIEAIRHELDVVRNRIARFRGIRAKLTSITTCAGEIYDDLDELRRDVLEACATVEAQLLTPGKVAAGAS